MKSKKKLALAGCTVALTLSAVLIVMNKDNTKKSTGQNTKSINDHSSFGKTKTGKREKPHTAQEIKVVYEAIKDNKIDVFTHFLEEGGSLKEVVEIAGKKMTLAEAVVKYERLSFIEKTAEIVSRPELRAGDYQHEAKELQLKEASAALSLIPSTNTFSQAAGTLVPLIQAVAKSARPSLKKGVLSLSKSNPEMGNTVKASASTALPDAVATCDQEQIRFLGDLGADPMTKNHDGKNGLDAAGKTKCFNAISYWKKEQNFDFDKKNDEGVSGFDVLAKFKDPELQTFTDKLQDEAVREISSLKPKVKRVSFYKKRVTSAIIDPEALVEPELRPDEATETAEFSEFSD